MRVKNNETKKNLPKIETWKKILSAIFYGFSSVLIVFVNKILLTNLKFPSFLWVGIGQMIFTIIFLYIAKFFKVIKIPNISYSTIKEIFPLPIFFVLNLISGLGGTQKLNLPMFTVLRRFSILMTMILEFIIIGTKPTLSVKLSVCLMILGSIVAAIYDFTFDFYGYFLVFINNICTAANGVYVKKKLEAKKLGKYGLLYYNSLLMCFPTIILDFFFNDGIEKIQIFVEKSGISTGLLFCFFLSCICGFILNYSFMLCSTYNSALTTTCIGPIKNLIVTYGGMIASNDYVFQWYNFLGVNISVLGSIIYTYITFFTPLNIAKKKFKNEKIRQITIFPKKLKNGNLEENRLLIN